MNQHFQSDQQQELSLITYSSAPAYTNSIPHFTTTKRAIAASKNIYYKDLGALTIEDYVIFSRLPEHPLWSHMERSIDFSFADELFSNLYTPYSKRPYAPSLLLKIHLVKTLEQLTDSEMETILMFDMAIRRFVGVPITFTGLAPATSGFEQERSCTYLFHACFDHILTQAYQHKLWGKRGECWLSEAIQPYSNKGQVEQHRQVLQASLAFIQHLKKYQHPMFMQAMQALKLANWYKQTYVNAGSEGRAAAYSKLIACAYTFLFWFEQESARSTSSWQDPEQDQHSSELQERLFSLLGKTVGVYNRIEAHPLHGEIGERLAVKIS